MMEGHEGMEIPRTTREQLDGTRCLVTGGCGFIGSHLAEALLRLGADVVILDDLSSGYRANAPDGTIVIEGSVLDRTALNQAIEGCTHVFHEAAMVSVPVSLERPQECLRINVLGTQLVCSEAAHAGVRRVVLASSAAAYGNLPVLPCHEDHPPSAWSPYAASKVAGELVLQSAARTTSVSTVSLRYFNVFGERQDPRSPYAAVISAFVDRLRHGLPPTVYGDGSQSRDFVHVANVVQANLLAATNPARFAGDVFNIGTGVRTDLRGLLETLAEILGVEAAWEHAEPRPGDIMHSLADISSARRTLGYEPDVSFREGIRRLVAAS